MRVDNIGLLGAAVICVALSSVGAKALENSVSVHAGPGVQWAVIGELPAGEEVFVSDCAKGSGQHDWCKVSFSGSEGYIHEGALAPLGERVVVAPVFTSGATQLRKQARSNAPVVSALPASTMVYVAHCSHGWLRGWCKVNAGARSGYVRADLLHRYGAQ